MELLFTNAGRRTYMIEYALALRAVFDLNVHVSDVSLSTAAMWVARGLHRFTTPRVDEGPDAYAEVLLAECRSRGIDLVIPLMDYELPVLARWKERFATEGVMVVVSPPEVMRRTLDKRECYSFCASSGLHIPQTWYEGEEIGQPPVPVVLKQIEGSGSVGMEIITDPDRLPVRVPPDYLVQEFIEGDEYGLDILNDFSGRFLHCCGRRKLEMRAGETDKAEVVFDARLDALAQKVSGAFRHVGNLDVDLIRTREGEDYFIDFNPRFGGGYPFTYAAGFDYLRTILALHQNQAPDPLPSTGRRIVGAKGINLMFYEVTS